jgi:hypothetical protein
LDVGTIKVVKGLFREAGRSSDQLFFLDVGHGKLGMVHWKTTEVRLRVILIEVENLVQKVVYDLKDLRPHLLDLLLAHQKVVHRLFQLIICQEYFVSILQNILLYAL